MDHMRLAGASMMVPWGQPSDRQLAKDLAKKFAEICPAYLGDSSNQYQTVREIFGME